MSAVACATERAQWPLERVAAAAKERAAALPRLSDEQCRAVAALLGTAKRGRR